MKSPPRISESEWTVMKAVWALAPCTAQQVVESLTKADATCHPKTIKTFLNRLVRKGALDVKKEGRAYSYYPLVSEEECVAAVSESFLDRVFGGSLKPMLANFVERKELSAREIQELKRLLDEK